MSHYFRTKADADRWYRQMLDRKISIRAGLEIEFEKVTLKDFAKVFLKKRWDPKKHNTWINDEQRLRTYVLPVFGDRSLNEITTTEWKQFLIDIVQVHGKSEATANRIRALVSKMYSDAITSEPRRAVDNPIRYIKAHNEREKRIKKIKKNFFQTIDEMRAYLQAAKEEQPSYYVYHMLNFNTGLRESQKIPLKWKDVDFKTKVIVVERSYMASNQTIKDGSKGHKAGDDYVVGINETLLEVLKWWKSVSPYNKPDDYLCYFGRGKHFQTWHLRKAHRRIIKRAGVPYITPHGVRHSYATHYVDQGGAIEDLQKMLGHKDITTTQIYLHVLPASMHKKANALNVTLGENTVTTVSPNQCKKGKKQTNKTKGGFRKSKGFKRVVGGVTKGT